MKKDRKIEPEKISIKALQTIKGSIESPPNLNLAASGEPQFDFDFQYGLSPDEKIVGIILGVTIVAIWPNQSNSQVTAAFTHELVFKVENLEDFVDTPEDSKPVVDRLMLGTLIGIAYSTIRGIIYTRTQGTALKGVILPVVDPKKFIPEEKPTSETSEKVNN